MHQQRVTRGYGLLEGFLAEQRSKTANQLIPSTHRSGRILDIGCGSHPLFLMETQFCEKYGLDRTAATFSSVSCENRLTILNHDIVKGGSMPFDEEYFDIVTMLAVFEHIEPDRLVGLMKEVKRILKPDGIFIMTTPAFWTDWLLSIMSKLRLVSPLEIEEHKAAYSHSRIASILLQAGFSRQRLRFGYFEMFMNIWTTAAK
jgi:SAM-dependent methyltransferase